MRASFQKKKSKLMTKRQDIISSDLSQSKFSIRDSQAEHKNSQKNGGLKKALEQLQTMLIDEKEAREDLQNKITNLQQRNIQRENEFRRIIQQTIPFCIKEKSSLVLNANLKSVHQKIMNFFEATQENVEQHLLEEKKLLQQQMQRKIQNLTTHVQKQLQQNRRLQSLNYETIHRQITKAMTLSTTILNENEQMKKTIKNLQFSNQVFREQKQLLIAQILQKKNLIQKLYNQLRISYDQQDRMNEEMIFIKEEKKRLQRIQDRTAKGQMEACFKTIQNIKAKPIRLFHTQGKTRQNDKSKDGKKTIKTQTSTLLNPHRIYSTIDVKASNSFKTSLNKTNTLERQQSGNIIEYQLRQNLKRQKRKVAEQYKKIQYLIGYKRSIDLFMKECYNNGNLNELNKGKIQTLLLDLKDKIENDSNLKEHSSKDGLQKNYKELFQDLQ